MNCSLREDDIFSSADSCVLKLAVFMCFPVRKSLKMDLRIEDKFYYEQRTSYVSSGW